MEWMIRTHLFFWIGGLVVFIGLLTLLGGMLTPFAVAFALAYLLKTPVQKLVDNGSSRSFAAVLVLLLFFSAFMALMAIILPVCIREMVELSNSMPEIILRTEHTLRDMMTEWGIPQRNLDMEYFVALFKAHTSQALKVGAGVLVGVLNGGGAVLGLLTFLAITPVAAFFIIKEWPQVIAKIDSLLPRASAFTIRDLVCQIDGRISGFVRGQLIVCALLATFYSFALSAVGLQYGVFVGLLTGVLSLIPFVGSFFGLTASILIGLFQVQTDGWGVLIAALCIFASGQFVEGNFITPKIIGDRVGLHPLWVIFALMAGAHLLGILGMLLAVPVAAAIAVLSGFAIEKYKKSTYYIENHDLYITTTAP